MTMPIEMEVDNAKYLTSGICDYLGYTGLEFYLCTDYGKRAKTVKEVFISWMRIPYAIVVLPDGSHSATIYPKLGSPRHKDWMDNMSLTFK